MNRLRDWFRLWFTFETNVTRSRYLWSGLALAAIKFGGDTLMVWLATGRLWTPRGYLGPVHALVNEMLPDAPPFLLPLLAVWALPFLWIGISMSVRRALDAGMSAWSALMFFVPFLSYLYMAVMCLVPSEPPRERPVHEPRAYESRLPGALLSIGAGALGGLLTIVVSVFALKSYAISLFLGAPFLVGAIAAFLFNRRYPASTRETLQVAAMSLACVGGVALGAAVEGALCLFMAAPLAMVIAAMGAIIGRRIALFDHRGATPAVMGAMLIPLAAALDTSSPPTALREVRSSIEINASPETVWQSVIAFPPLEPPTELSFRAGISYPVRAEIRGSGVGAVRYCVFSTGAFVEPITRWEPNRRLSFDVDSQPKPLTEWSPYARIATPHLDGYFRSRRGEFRLIPLANGHTRLEGSTWYEMKLYPEAYWVLFGDAFISQIHRRVLQHIQHVAEPR